MGTATKLFRGYNELKSLNMNIGTMGISVTEISENQER